MKSIINMKKLTYMLKCHKIMEKKEKKSNLTEIDNTVNLLQYAGKYF